MSTWPLVSVVVPTRDRPALAAKAVEAICQQRYPGPIECLVVHDGCAPDPTLRRTGRDRRVEAVVNRRRPGLAGARNTGILAARGELVAFCDDDDAWLPTKLTRQVLHLRAHPHTDVVVTGIVIDNGRRRIARVPDVDPIRLADLVRSRISAAHPSTIVARRELFTGAVGLIDEGLPGSYAEDYDWLLRAARVRPLGVVQQPLVEVRWHRGSYFASRWQTIVEALEHLERGHPEFRQHGRGLARIYGQRAFAEAAMSHRPEARRWALRALRLRATEPRAYLALLISAGLLSPIRVVRALNAVGRGI